MKRPPSPSQRAKKGSALVIVLSFVVILSVILLAYLSRTGVALRSSNSSAAIANTDLLAQTATETILDDLRREMLAGADGAALPAGGQPMLLSQPAAMRPGRVLSPNIDKAAPEFANLVKQSLSGVPFYPGDSPATFSAKDGKIPETGAARASNVSTQAPSQNGRLISPERWNKPALLSGAGFSNNQLPDWILINRSGPLDNGATPGKYQDNTPANPEYVIGRFAYNIYDIGGLLDVNVAGFDSTKNGALENAARKGSMAWADLSAIPGVLKPSALVSWRNKLSNNDYLSIIQEWSEPHGFLKSFEQGGDADNRFYTRQDLLKFVQDYGKEIVEKEALPYLTTFSADLNQPSFAPDPSRPKVLRSSANGGNDAFGLDDQINPNFLAVLNAEQKPIVKRRFPLERLKYLRRNPSGEDAAKAEEYFGLRWNTSLRAWNYVDGNQIKRLSEITGREPNFIELLKAAITVGSLGGQFENANPQEPLESPRRLGGRDGSINYHIIQIVSNIIDQYDEDSYPTRIEFDGNSFSGSEDLPYLYLVRNAPYRKELVAEDDLREPPPVPPGWSGRTVPYRCVLMLQPTLWNPHAPNPEAPTFDGPTRFRITASTNGGSVEVKAQGAWWQADKKGYYNDYPSRNPADVVAPATFNPLLHYIDFSTTTSGKAAFREPYTITSPNYPPGSGATGYMTETILAGEEENEASDGKVPTTQVLGFKVGNLWGGPAFKSDTTNAVYDFLQACRLENSGGLEFELQYLGPDGQYVTYDKMEAFAATQNPAWHDWVTATNRGRPIMRYGTKFDPRTDRFGFRDGNNYVHRTATTDAYRHWLQGWTAWRAYLPGGDAGNFKLGSKFGNGSAARNGAKVTDPSTIGWTFEGSSSFWQFIVRNKASDGTHYLDPDGVLRHAMAGYTNDQVGLPLITGNNEARPVILNRPFRSVAELGYAFRGIPWKQLDFWTPESGDTALLDLFCLYEQADENAEPITAGKLNLNTKHSETLQAMLRGTAKADGVTLSETEARRIADALVAWTESTQSSKGPLRNRGELVGRYNAASKTYTGFSSELTALLPGKDGIIQQRRQSVMRALVDGGTARSWSFLIDMIVQDGRYPRSVTALDKFSVRGERRYWIHVSMDRYTGKVISKLVEVVHE